MTPVEIIAEAASSPAARHYVNSAVSKLTPSSEEYLHVPGWNPSKLYKMAIAATMLLCKPKSFMEIGVRRGHALAVATLIDPEVYLVGFDIWHEVYGNEPNPGADFVKQELAKLGKTTGVDLFKGPSKETVPDWQWNHPTVTFDLIGVDGSHDVEDAKVDLDNSLDSLSIGGILIFDDIFHPAHLDLLPMWKEYAAKGNYEHAEIECEYGFGILRKCY